MEKRFWTYILASGYDVHRLVYFEEHSTAEDAIKREKRLKKYNRDWKKNLIEKDNPEWKDLYESVCG
jgi:putative endonuclease